MEHKAILQAVTGGLDFPIFTVDRTYRYTHFNPAHQTAMQTRYGTGIELGQFLFAQWPRADRDIAQGYLDRALGGETVITPTQPAPEGPEHGYFQIVYQPVYDDEGSVTGAAVLTQEIREREQAMEVVRLNERRFRRMVESSSDAIGLLDANGIIQYDSPSAPGLLGYGPDDWLGKSALTLIHPDDVTEVRARLQAVALRPQGSQIESVFRIQHKAGHWMWLEAKATNLLGDPAIEAIVINYRDISAQVEAQRRLSESENRLRQVWEMTSDAMAISDAAGTVLSVNPAYLRLYGFSEEEVIDKNFSVIFPPEMQAAALASYAQTFALGIPPLEVEAEIVRADGTPRTVESQVAFLRSPDGSKLMLSTVRDITERKLAEKVLHQTNRQLAQTIEELQRTQAQLVHQERLAAVGQLAAGIAHDFNNILSVILLQLQLGLRQPNLPKGLRERLQLIADQAERAANLVQQILDFSRNAILRTQPVAARRFFQEQVVVLRRLIPESVEIFLDDLAQGADSGAVAHVTPGIVINADVPRIQQLLINLALNAGDAMPQGGQFRIGLGVIEKNAPARTGENKGEHEPPSSPPDARIETATWNELPRGRWLLVEVRDTGVGIEENTLARIFEPFFSTKGPGRGTGLGLAQVYGIAKQHEGYIDVESKVGAGTTFRLYFPVVQSKADAMDLQTDSERA